MKIISLNLMKSFVDIAAFFYFNQLIEEQKEPLNEKIQKEYNLRKKDSVDHGKTMKEK